MKNEVRPFLRPAFVVGSAVISSILLISSISLADDRIDSKPLPTEVAQKQNAGIFHLQGSTKENRALDAALQRTNDSVSKARTLLDLGNLEAAQAECLRAVASAPTIGGVSVAARPKQLLGEIALLQGNNTEALLYFLSLRNNTLIDGLDWKIALCYVRLGEFAKAKRFYSQDAFLQQATQLTKTDLPGTQTAKQLEASILVALGTEENSMGHYEKALRNFDTASRLAPGNPWILHSKGINLMRLQRPAEAYTAFQQIIRLGDSKYMEDAKQQIRRFEVNWRLHPETKPKDIKLL